MPFSHKPRPGFELHSIPRPERRRFRAVIREHSPHALALAFALTTLAGAGPAPAAAAPAHPAPAVVSRVAPAAPGGDALAGVEPSDNAAPVPASITYPARARRRTPRPAAEIRSEARPAPVQPPGTADINGWLEYKARAHVLALPVEARLFY